VIGIVIKELAIRTASFSGVTVQLVFSNSRVNPSIVHLVSRSDYGLIHATVIVRSDIVILMTQNIVHLVFRIIFGLIHATVLSRSDSPSRVKTVYRHGRSFKTFKVNAR
jgi:ABC-type enterochelin transport system permease subunit